MTYTNKATCRFDVASWKESAYVDIDEGEGTTAGDMYYPKRGLTVTEVEYTYRGDVEGTSTERGLIAFLESLPEEQAKVEAKIEKKARSKGRAAAEAEVAAEAKEKLEAKAA